MWGRDIGEKVVNKSRPKSSEYLMIVSMVKKRRKAVMTILISL